MAYNIYIACEKFGEEVTHWMPLPDHPKEVYE